LLILGDRYRLIATDADAFSFGLYQVDERYLVPLAAMADYIPAVLRIVEREAVDVVLPGTEPELQVLSEHQDALAAAGCTVITSSPEIVRLCSNKWQLHNWLAARGYRVPRTSRPGEWRDLVAEVGYPVVGKPTEKSGGSRNVALLKDEMEIEDYLAESDRRHLEVILQQYVGAVDAEYTVGVLISRAGELIDSIVLHRKLIGLSLGAKRIVDSQVYALSTGYSQGFIVKHGLVQSVCEQLALTLGIRGPVNIQCRLVGSEVVVFEVHPRFSGTTSIRAEVGFNGPDIVIRDFLFRERFGRLTYQSNVAAIRALQHTIIPLEELQDVPSA
jgi:carbamoyl-phosphate synthase large subunit